VKNLDLLPGFIKYKIIKGEWIEKIATKYKTTTEEICKDNHSLLKQKYLRHG
jgi:hypothetical protein